MKKKWSEYYYVDDESKRIYFFQVDCCFVCEEEMIKNLRWERVENVLEDLSENNIEDALGKEKNMHEILDRRISYTFCLGSVCNKCWENSETDIQCEGCGKTGKGHVIERAGRRHIVCPSGWTKIESPLSGWGELGIKTDKRMACPECQKEYKNNLRDLWDNFPRKS